MSIRVVIFEDQSLLAQSIALSIPAKMDAIILGTYSSATEGLNATNVLALAQIALIDIKLADGYAFDLVARLRANYPDLKMLWFTGMIGDYPLFRATEAQLPGFVHKDDPLEVLITAIKVVEAGEVFTSQSILNLQSTLRTNNTNCFRLLSPRELEVLSFLGSGYSNEEAATLLGVSAGTVHSHRRNIMLKLDLHTAAELVSFATRHDFVDVKKLTLSGRPPPLP